MKKMLLAGVVVVALGVAAYFGAGMLADKNDAGVVASATGDEQATAEGASSGASAGAGSGQAGDPNQPERTAEVKGTVISVDGTTVIVDRLLTDRAEELTEEEKAAKRAERQGMTMEERQAAKAAEQAGLETERVSVEVPVGVTITKMAAEGDAMVPKPAMLADIKVGLTVTIWTDGAADGGVAEYVKIQGTN